MNNLITVPFHNQSLSAVLVDSVPHVAMKPICENIGIDWEGQRQKTLRHPVLNSTTCMIKAVAEDGKLREMLMLPLKMLNGWLFLIDANRVKPQAKKKVIEYQEECFDVLANHFMPQRLGINQYKPITDTENRDYLLAKKIVDNLKQCVSGDMLDDLIILDSCLNEGFTRIDESLHRMGLARIKMTESLDMLTKWHR